MDILIVAEYLDNIKNPVSYNSRFLTIADLLVAKGHTVRIATTNFIHSSKQHISGVDSYKGCELKALHEPGYPRNVCIKRFYSHYVLSKNLKKWLENVRKPDVIYCAVPSLDFAYEAAKFAKKHNIKLITDIQDLWPEAFEMVLNIPLVSRLIFTPFRWRAKYLYRTADKVVAVSQTYINRALQERNDKSGCKAVFLGTDLSRFDSYKAEAPALVKQENDLWLGYVGTLGHSYDMKTVFDAMVLLKDKDYYDRLKFVIVGDGPLKSEFEQYSKEKNLNVCFTGMQPYPNMVSTLCRCDIAINPIKKKSAGSIINKHGDYAASGIPVINTQESPEYRQLVEEYGMGLNCECESASDVADKIDKLLKSKELRTQMGAQARKCAEERFDRNHTYSEIIKAIEN